MSNVADPNKVTKQFVLPSGNGIELTIEHGEITLPRKKRDPHNRIVRNEKGEIVFENVTYRGTNVEMLFGSPKLARLHLKGFSVCKPPDAFIRSKGTKEALRNTFEASERDVDAIKISHEDKKAIYLAIFPHFKEALEAGEKLRDQRIQQKKQKKLLKGVTAQQKEGTVINVDRLRKIPVTS